jgi:hypothetical protein
MTLLLKQFGTEVTLIAGTDELFVQSTSMIDWTRPETWPLDALESGSGRRTAY